MCASECEDEDEHEDERVDEGRALRLLDEMHQQGLQLNVITYTAGMGECGRTLESSI